MSFIYNWYEDRRTVAQKRQDAERDVRYYVKKCRVSKVDELLNEYNFDVNSECLDEHGNTLLHIAVKSKLRTVAQYLIRRGASSQKRNGFGETSWDVAIRFEDSEMVKILLGFQDTIDVLTEVKTKLGREVLQLRKGREQDRKEIEGLKRGIKRTRCEDCEEKDRTIKKMRNEKRDEIEKVVKITTRVSELEKDNQDLKTTVDSLRSSFKK